MDCYASVLLIFWRSTTMIDEVVVMDFLEIKKWEKSLTELNFSWVVEAVDDARNIVGSCASEVNEWKWDSRR